LGRPWLEVTLRGGGARVRALAGREQWLFVACAATAAVYTLFSFLNHSHFRSGTDLAIFDQAIWHYSRFEWPRSTFLAPWGYENFLGDHFEPILILLAPLYWVWDNVGVLLIAQAVLLAASIVPVFVFCRRRLGRTGAYLMALAYVSFWGIASAIAFGFHEVAFVPLLLASILLAAEDRRWRLFAVLIAVLLLVKENTGVLVAFIGLYVALTQREWRKGALAAAAGVTWFVLATDVIQPLFNDGRAYRHWMYRAVGRDLTSALANMVADPTLVPRVFFKGTFDPGIGWATSSKVGTLALIFLPFFGLALLSPIGILLIPLLLERMLAGNPWLWTPYLHYSLTIAPVLIMGSADALSRLARWRPLMPRARMVLVGGAAAIAAANLAVATRFPLKDLTTPSFYGPTAADRARERALARVPPDASVLTGSQMMAHLTHRGEVYEMRSHKAGTEYIVTDPAEYFWTRWPKAGYVDRQRIFLDKAAKYEPVYAERDVVVLKRRSDLASKAPQAPSGRER
jgi:uncharacterized membrane protein